MEPEVHFSSASMAAAVAAMGFCSGERITSPQHVPLTAADANGVQIDCLGGESDF